MLYFLETNLLNNKSIFFALTKIYGIGKNKGLLVCKKLGFASNLKVKGLNQKQIIELLQLINLLNFKINTELKYLKSLTLRNLVNIKSFRGLRRLKGLPVRGQRSHTNAKTAKKNIIKKL